MNAQNIIARHEVRSAISTLGAVIIETGQGFKVDFGRWEIDEALSVVLSKWYATESCAHDAAARWIRRAAR
jgi:hypothetical protein